MRKLFVLGAADPEMAAIESLLIARGERFAYATCEGKRVHPGNAYRADDVSDGYAWGAVTHLVECGALPQYAVRETVVRCDHHRPGDVGYGLPPEQFLAGSSIGQVVSLLGCLNTSPDYGDGIEDLMFAGKECGLTVENIRYIAAADHCLESAYRGLCPGVDPDTLMAIRVALRAEFQNKLESEVMADIEEARETLLHAVTFTNMAIVVTTDRQGSVVSSRFGRPVGCMMYADENTPEGCWEHNSVLVADLRGQIIPELPEAAAYEGIPFLSTVTERDGRKKVVLMAAPHDLIKRFLAGEIIGDLVDMYGDPARGFAGGYLQS